MQQLAMRGVVDLSPNRSASIRKFDLHQTLEVLEVAGEMTSLAASIAARNYDPVLHAEPFATVMRNLADSENSRQPGEFSRARRQYYRSLLSIGGHRELTRLFPAISMHLIYSQYQSSRLQQIRLVDYRAIFSAVCAKDSVAAAAAGRAHVDHVRDVLVASYAAGGKNTN